MPCFHHGDFHAEKTEEEIIIDIGLPEQFESDILHFKPFYYTIKLKLKIYLKKSCWPKNTVFKLKYIITDTIEYKKYEKIRQLASTYNDYGRNET